MAWVLLWGARSSDISSRAAEGGAQMDWEQGGGLKKGVGGVLKLQAITRLLQNKFKCN